MARVIFSAIILTFLLADTLRGQGEWDADKESPPTRRRISLPEPLLKIEPFSLFVYEQCEPDWKGQPRQIGRLGIDVTSQYQSIGFISSSTDSTLTLKIKSRNRGEKKESFRIPQQSFELRVILGSDTAICWVDRSNDHFNIDYRRRSKLMVLEEIHVLDDSIAFIQFAGASQRTVKELVRSLEDEFEDSFLIDQLPSGYYPCLPIPTLETAVIGRGKRALRVNKTEFGYLVCVRIVDPNKYEAIASYLYEHQKLEFKKLRAERG